MRLGISLPTGGAFATSEAIAAVAEGAERIGLDSVWTFERLLRPTAGGASGGQTVPLPDEYTRVFSPLEVLAFAAARTSRITLGTSVIVVPLHNPAALGRSLATVDQLSGGRLVAGIGQGWMEQEFAAVGISPARRGARFEEFVAALRAVWGPDPVAFDGEFYAIAESEINPKPVRAGGPPVIVGAGSPAAIARTARLGLGLNPIWFGAWEPLEASVSAFRAALAENGADVDGVPVVLRVNEPIAEKPTGAEATPAGSAEQVVEALPRLAEIGVTEVFWTMSLPPEEQLERASQVVELAGA